VELDEDNVPHLATKVSEFIQNFLLDIPKLNQILNYHPIIHKIIEIAIPLTDIKQSFCSSGESSIRIATWLAHDSKAYGCPYWRYRGIWKLNAMPKVKVFMQNVS